LEDDFKRVRQIRWRGCAAREQEDRVGNRVWLKYRARRLQREERAHRRERVRIVRRGSVDRRLLTDRARADRRVARAGEVGELERTRSRCAQRRRLIDRLLVAGAADLARKTTARDRVVLRLGRRRAFRRGLRLQLALVDTVERAAAAAGFLVDASVEPAFG